MKYKVRIHIEEIINNRFGDYCRNIREPEEIGSFDTLLDAEEFVAGLIADEPGQCPKCGDLIGINIDDKPICGCSVSPRLENTIHRPHKQN